MGVGIGAAAVLPEGGVSRFPELVGAGVRPVASERPRCGVREWVPGGAGQGLAARRRLTSLRESS